MQYLFSGIEVPRGIRVSDEDIENNHPEIIFLGETLESHIIKGVGLTAYWGKILREHHFSPDFQVGVYDDPSGTVTRFRPDSEDFKNTDDTTENQHAIAELDDVYIPGIQAVCGFYDIDPDEAMSAGIYLRGKILSGWDIGHRFAFTTDARQWMVHADTIDPLELL